MARIQSSAEFDETIMGLYDSIGRFRSQLAIMKGMLLASCQLYCRVKLISACHEQ